MGDKLITLLPVDKGLIYRKTIVRNPAFSRLRIKHLFDLRVFLDCAGPFVGRPLEDHLAVWSCQRILIAILT
jgi:hypothetical protein